MEASPDTHPDALDDASEPTVERIEIDGARIHTEVRGAGEPILLIGAADEDAEVYRGIAERLAASNTVASASATATCCRSRAATSARP